MCLYTVYRENKAFQANKKNGGIIPHCDNEKKRLVPISCGNCIDCRKKKAREWKVRLLEYIKENKGGNFITLTFNTIEYEKLRNEVLKKEVYENEYKLDNDICAKAVRRYTDLYRKNENHTLKHFLITEIGGKNYENIHIHGIIWGNKDALKHWKFGYTWDSNKKKGSVGEKTINYITKYIFKIDQKHKGFKPKIFASKGIGANYKNKINNFDGINTDQTYILKSGKKIALPHYIRMKTYSDEERQALWNYRLNENVMYLNGKKFNMNNKKEVEEFEKVREEKRLYSIKHGFGSGKNEMSIDENRQRYLKKREQIENNRNKKKPKNTTTISKKEIKPTTEKKPEILGNIEDAF